MLAGWTGLARTWLVILVVLGLGGGVLQMLGPPAAAPRPTSDHPKSQNAASDHPTSQNVAKIDAGSAGKPAGPLPRHPKPAENAEFEAEKPGRTDPGPVNDPDPALLEPNREAANTFLPRISLDGRAPMHEYAAGFDPSSRLARVGIVVAGVGMSEAYSTAAIHLLPAAVTLALSPYVTNPDRLLASARIAEHEYLLSVPMEPQGFPANDPDEGHALMTALPPAENLKRLHWAMSRFGGYVGVTNALGQMGGERLSSMAGQFDPVLKDVASRGLLFVDARPGQPVLRLTWNRSVDLVLDADPLDEASLDGRLEVLAKLAKDNRTALGLVTVPRPMTLHRIAAWTNTLRDRGLALAPVSALVVPPATQEQDK